MHKIDAVALEEYGEIIGQGAPLPVLRRGEGICPLVLRIVLYIVGE
jgi:hypothetical protein